MAKAAATKTKSLRYTPADMDAMVRATQAHRQALIGKGLIDHVGRLVEPSAPGPEPPEPVTHDGYCVKCRKRRTVETEGVEEHPYASRAHGPCPVCGTGVHTFKTKEDGQKIKDALESNRAQTSP